MRFAVIPFTKSRKWNNCKKQLFVVHFKCQLWNKKALKPTAKQSEGLLGKKREQLKNAIQLCELWADENSANRKWLEKKTLRGYNGCLKMQSLAITKKGSSWEHSLGFCVVCFHRKNGGWSSFKTEKKLKRTLKNPSGHARLHFSALSFIFIRWRLSRF